MSARSCQEFRTELEQALLGRPERALEKSKALGFHEHLLSCSECRDLFDQEESLETLLANWSIRELSRTERERLLRRLEQAGAAAGDPDDLDQLLELDRNPTAPGDLARRVLDGVAGERADAKLDALLERVPAPVPPAGLAERVLQDLEPVRRPAPALRLLPGGARTLVALAAALLVALGLWQVLVVRDPSDAQPDRGQAVAVLPPPTEEVPSEQVDEELLASMEILENWDLLMGEDLDALLTDLDEDDLVLLALADGTLLEEVLFDDEGGEEEG